ncbi:MAG: DUF5661 family protein [Minisyncoccia bacterium]
MDPFSHFVREMRKTAVSKGQLGVSQSRSGRRPMSVDTLLRKEKEGSLYKQKTGEAVGIEIENGKKRVLSGPEAERQIAGIQEGLGDLPNAIHGITDPFLSGLRHLFSGQLHGGLAEKAGKLPGDFDPIELSKGEREEEHEHTNDPQIAQQIAMDHLTEHPAYYEALEKMEQELDREEKHDHPVGEKPIEHQDEEKHAWAKMAMLLAPGLKKEAKTRMVKEWRKAHAAGDTAMKSALEGAAGKLELNPRHLRDLGRGEEATAMHMMGGLTPTGYKVPAGQMVQKLYDPQSLVSRGDLTGRVLADKQKITDVVNQAAKARGESAPMAEMYGFNAPGKERWQSFHEYVPGKGLLPGDEELKNMSRTQIGEVKGNIHKALGRMTGVVQKGNQDVAGHGLNIQDVVVPRTGGGNAINAGNVVPTAGGGHKILDFLPGGSGYHEGDPRKEFAARIQADPSARHDKALLGRVLQGKGPSSAQEMKNQFYSKDPNAHKPLAPLPGGTSAGDVGLPFAKTTPVSGGAASYAKTTPALNVASTVPASPKSIQAGGKWHQNPYARAGMLAGGAALLGGGAYLAHRHFQNKKKQREEAAARAEAQKTSSASWAKLADSWKPQWLEIASTPNDRFMQAIPPTMGKKARGDSPSMDEGYAEGQRPKAPASYAQPTNNAIAMKEAAAWSKIARSVGNLVKSPTDTVPDVEGPPNRIQRQEDRNFFIGSSSDAQPTVGTSTDAYTRA